MTDGTKSQCVMKKSRASWWCMPIILALERLTQGTYWFKTILVIMLDPVTKQTNTKNTIMVQ